MFRLGRNAQLLCLIVSCMLRKKIFFLTKFVSFIIKKELEFCWYFSVLFGSTHDVTSHLQRIQNYAALVILRLPKSSSITIHLKSLHWLPVKVSITYKIACLYYHCHSSTAPSYVTGMLHRKPLHTRTSSYTMHLLNRPAPYDAIFEIVEFVVISIEM